MYQHCECIKIVAMYFSNMVFRASQMPQQHLYAIIIIDLHES